MRWKIARFVFFGAGLLVILSFLVLITEQNNESTLETVYFAYTAVALALVITMLTVSGLERYPRVSYGRTSAFFFTLYTILFVLVIYAVGVVLSWYAAGLAFTGGVVLLLIWTAIVRYIKKRIFAVFPDGSVEFLRKVFNGRFEFTEIEDQSPEIFRDSVFDGLIIDSQRTIPKEWRDFATQAQLQGMPVVIADDLIERYAGRMSLNYLDERTATQIQPNVTYAPVKRIIDILIVIVSFPVLFCILALLTLCIRLESRGSAIFTQPRIGKGEKPFTIYKFRSMRIDAEHIGPEFADEDDSRITRVGRFMRKFRLDELPQFWNIARGEMSLIGPRPEQVPIAQRFRETIPFYSYRHLVKPGITGWAQVTHGYTADKSATEVKLEHDLYYIKHYSIWLDLLIGVKTIKTILTGFGAR